MSKKEKETHNEVADLREENAKLRELLETTKESEAHFRLLLNNVPIAIWQEDFSGVQSFLDGIKEKGVNDFLKHFTENPEDVAHCVSLIKVVDLNHFAMKMTGLNEKPSGIDNLPRVFNKEYESLFAKEFAALANGDTTYRSEAVTVDTDDRSMDIIFQLNVLPGHENDLSEVLVSVTDVTEENLLAQKLNHAELRWSSIFKSLSDSVLIIDRDLNIVTTNFGSLFNATGDEPLLGQNILNEVIDDQRDKVEQFTAMYSEPVSPINLNTEALDLAAALFII